MEVIDQFVIKNETVVDVFFERYNQETCLQKLNAIYTAYASVDEERGGMSPNQEFCKDLILLLQEIRVVLAQPKYLPIQLEPLFSEEIVVSLTGIVNLLKEAIPIGLIYNLSKTKGELDLIIVLEKSCTQAYEEFEGITALAALGYKVVNCTIHNHGLLNKLLRGGHIFYNAACIADNIIYKKSTEEMFAELDPILFEINRAEAEMLFEQSMNKASHFYDSAQHFIAHETYDMAMFMLQQTCELTYRCLLKVLRGKDVKCHSLIVLRKHLKRFAPEVVSIFSIHEEEEAAYLQLLEEAYVKARYTLDYKITHALVYFLNNGLYLLQQKAIQLFRAKMQAVSDQMALARL